MTAACDSIFYDRRKIEGVWSHGGPDSLKFLVPDAVLGFGGSDSPAHRGAICEPPRRGRLRRLIFTMQYVEAVKEAFARLSTWSRRLFANSVHAIPTTWHVF